MPNPPRASGRLAYIHWQTHSCFVGLPSEIRSLIFKHLFLDLAVQFRHDYETGPPDQGSVFTPRHTFANVSRACHLFHSEIQPVFFSNTTFVFSRGNDFRKLLFRVTKDALRLIRYVEFELATAVHFEIRNIRIQCLRWFANLRQVDVQLARWMLFYGAGTCWEDAVTTNLLWINCVESSRSRYLHVKSRRNVMDLPVYQDGEYGWLTTMVSEAAAGRQDKPFRLVLVGTVSFSSSVGPEQIHGVGQNG